MQQEVEVYRQRVARYFPGLKIKSFSYFGQGWDFFVFLVNGRLLFRFPRREEVVSWFLREVKLLPGLGPRLPIPVPKFQYLWLGDEEDPHPFAGYEMVAGERLTAAVLAGLEQEGLAQQLGGFLRELHRFPVEEAQALGVACYTVDSWWRERWAPWVRKVEELALPLLTPLQRERASDLFRRLETVLVGAAFRPCLVHNDLGPEHILYQGSRITGVVDWTDALVGDPAVDFSGLTAAYGGAFAERVRQEYALEQDPGLLERAALYARLWPYNDVCFGVEQGLPQHIEAGLRGLEEGTGTGVP
ncbi:MAG: phosphotransferase, partial [Chloroflexi bacterium]|nr:phosphotransferase [Chloroflexota bacterium]